VGSTPFLAANLVARVAAEWTRGAIVEAELGVGADCVQRSSTQSGLHVVLSAPPDMEDGLADSKPLDCRPAVD